MNKIKGIILSKQDIESDYSSISLDLPLLAEFCTWQFPIHFLGGVDTTTWNCNFTPSRRKLREIPAPLHTALQESKAVNASKILLPVISPRPFPGAPDISFAFSQALSSCEWVCSIANTHKAIRCLPQFIHIPWNNLVFIYTHKHKQNVSLKKNKLRWIYLSNFYLPPK